MQRYVSSPSFRWVFAGLGLLTAQGCAGPTVPSSVSSSGSTDVSVTITPAPGPSVPLTSDPPQASNSAMPTAATPPSEMAPATPSHTGNSATQLTEEGSGPLSGDTSATLAESSDVLTTSTADSSGFASQTNSPDAGAAPPDPGNEGDGDFEVSAPYSTQPELTNLGSPKGRRFQFRMRLADSRFFDGQDPTLDPTKIVNSERSIVVYVPAKYVDGSPAPLLVIQDGPGDIDLVENAIDNLTHSTDTTRRLPAFVAIAVQNGGGDAQGSERGLEYDTMSDRYARFIDEEVLEAVASEPAIRDAYPNLSFTTDPSGRAALGCSSGGAAALTMGWFRPDLFGRIITYSGTFVDQQNHAAPEAESYPEGAWGYHSNQRLIQNAPPKPLRIFLNVNENDLRSNDPESTLHNWVMANQRTAAALLEQGYHYRFVFGRGAGHCDGGVRRATLADALVWAWRGYQEPQR